MYKDVAKRVLAILLTVCMVCSIPDVALLATGTDSAGGDIGISQEAAADDLKEASEEETEMFPEAFEEVEGTLEEAFEGETEVLDDVSGLEQGTWEDTASREAIASDAIETEEEGGVTPSDDGTLISLDALTVKGATDGKLNEPQVWLGEGREVRPSIILLNGQEEIPANAETFDLVYSNNTEVGATGQVTITAKSDTAYTGSKTVLFDIKKSLEDVQKPERLPNQLDKNLQANPVIVIGLELVDGGRTLVQKPSEDSPYGDYTIRAEINQTNHTATITLTGCGNYMGEFTYRNVPIGTDIDDCTVTLDGSSATPSYPYTAQPITPEVRVQIATFTLVEGTDYQIIPANNTDVGSADNPDESKRPCIVIQGMGQYAGEKRVYFNITSVDIRTLYEVTCEDTIYNKKAAKDTAKGIPPANLKILNKTTGEPALEKDYELEFSGNHGLTPAGSLAEVKVKSKAGGNCTGELSATYRISQADFAQTYTGDDQIFVELKNDDKIVYTGKPIKPEIIVYQGDKEDGLLEPGVDYTYEDPAEGQNINAGKGTITVTGINNYKGTKPGVQFDIERFNINNIRDLPEGEAQLYTGSACNPEAPASIRVDAVTTLINGTDYTADYVNNTDVGKAYIRLTGKGNCTGMQYIPFVIYQTMDKVTVAPVAPQQYTGDVITPVLTVTDNGTELKKLESADTGRAGYTVSYNPAAPTQIGTGYTITVTGDGLYYRGSQSVTFDIVRREMGSVQAVFRDSVENNAYAFTGSVIKPGVSVRDDQGKLLPEGDFTFVYKDGNGNVTENPVDAGAYLVEIIPDPAKYVDTTQPVTLNYTIEPRPLAEGSNFNISLAYQTVEYDGDAKEPAVTAIDCLRNASGAAVASGGIYSMAVGTDFTISYQANRNAGLAKAVITGRKNYTGTVEREFRINPKSFGAGANITIELDDGQTYTYTGDVIAPVVKTLVVDGRTLSGEEFTVSSEGVDAGQHPFTVVGNGNYTGSISSDTPGVASGSALYTIDPKDIGDEEEVLIAEIPNQAFSGSPVYPVPEIEYRGHQLENDKDFTLEHRNNTAVDVGVTDESAMPAVVITGKGNYTGTRTERFHIRESIAAAVVGALDQTEFTYTSKEHTPKPASVTLNGERLLEGFHYTIRYRNNIDAWVASRDDVSKRPTVIVEGIGDYGGTVELPFSINRVAMQSQSGGGLKQPFSVTVGKNTTFTGSPVIPTLSIRYGGAGSGFTYILEEGKDYMLNVSNNINPGTTQYFLSILPRGNFTTTELPLNVARYTIAKKPITADEISIELGEVDPTQKPAVKPTITIVDTKRAGDGTYVPEGGTYTLQENVDYTLTWKNNTVPGTASVTVAGIGKYDKSKTISFVIPGNLSAASVKFTDSDGSNEGRYKFTGFEIKPKITVSYGDESSGQVVLREGRDYQYTVIGDNRNCSNDHPKVHLEGIGAYEGSIKEEEFIIERRELTDKDVKIALAASYDYNDGKNVEPKPKITLGRYELTEEVDYICQYEPDCALPSNASGKKYEIKIIAVAQGNFAGNVSREYAIGNNFDVKIKFANEEWNNQAPSTTYTGEEIPLDLIVTDEKEDGSVYELVLGKDYDVQFSPDRINVGKVDILVYGLGEPGADTDYCGSKTIRFEIVGKKLSDSDIVIEDIEDYTYSGDAIMPRPTVKWLGHGQDGADRELVEGTDFRYTYSANTNAGEATVAIEAVRGSNFADGATKKTKTFKILPKNLTDEDVTVEGIPDQVYTGKAITPKINIRWGDDNRQRTLSASDYEPPSYTENVEIGVVTMEITGKGNYTGTITVEFRIVPVKLADITVEYSEEEQYTGKQITPPVSLSYLSTDGEKIEMVSPEVWNYTLTYGENKRLGTSSGSITFTAAPNGHCEEGSFTKYFAIVPRNITDATVELSGLEPSYVYDPAIGACEPVPTLTFTPDIQTVYTLKQNFDYTVKYENNTGVTQDAKVIIEGLGNFTGKIEWKFSIAKDLLDFIVGEPSVDTSKPLVYNGLVQHPDIHIEFLPGNRLTEGTDYRLDWSGDCLNAGEHTVTIVGIGEYSGSIELTFTIAPRPISSASFPLEDQEFTGSEVEIDIIGKDQDGDGNEIQLGGDSYEILEIGPHTAVGTVNVTIGGVGNYTGETVTSFQIVPRSLKKDYIAMSELTSPLPYTGEAVLPEFTIQDKGRDANGEALSAREGEDFYTLREGVDYEVECENNTRPGIASVSVTGIGNYADDLSGTFEIQADLSMAEIAPIPAQQYTGEAVEPKLTVSLDGETLEEGVDYIVTYQDNIERGTASATITPVEGRPYMGEQTVHFEISRDIGDAVIRLIDTEFTYTGNAITPAAAVMLGDTVLTEGTDYAIQYSDNINVGTAHITITGMGGYDGTNATTFAIVPRSILRCSFDNVVTKIYDGTATGQDLVVSEGNKRLALNQDYTVSYVNNANPGIATLVVTGIGNYGGIKTIRYLINVTDMTPISVAGKTNSVTLAWSAVLGAEGYEIYNANNDLIARTAGLSYTHADLDALTSYTYKVRPYITADGATYYGGFSNTVQATTSIAKPVVSLKPGKKRATVSWKKIKGVNGYEIYRSTKKTKGYKKIKTAKKVSIVSYTNKKLKAKKKYYYKIRAYKTVNGRKMYSSYSSPKAVKTK